MSLMEAEAQSTEAILKFNSERSQRDLEEEEKTAKKRAKRQKKKRTRDSEDGEEKEKERTGTTLNLGGREGGVEDVNAKDLTLESVLGRKGYGQSSLLSSESLSSISMELKDLESSSSSIHSSNDVSPPALTPSRSRLIRNLIIVDEDDF